MILSHLNLGYLHATGPETSTLISISPPHPEVNVTVKFVSTLLLSDATSYVRIPIVLRSHTHKKQHYIIRYYAIDAKENEHFRELSQIGS